MFEHTRVREGERVTDKEQSTEKGGREREPDRRAKRDKDTETDKKLDGDRQQKRHRRRTSSFIILNPPTSTADKPYLLNQILTRVDLLSLLWIVWSARRGCGFGGGDRSSRWRRRSGDVALAERLHFLPFLVMTEVVENRRRVLVLMNDLQDLRKWRDGKVISTSITDYLKAKVKEENVLQ